MVELQFDLRLIDERENDCVPAPTAIHPPFIDRRDGLFALDHRIDRKGNRQFRKMGPAWARHIARREARVNAFIVVHRQHNLFEVIQTLDPATGLT